MSLNREKRRKFQHRIKLAKRNAEPASVASTIAKPNQTYRPNPVSTKGTPVGPPEPNKFRKVVKTMVARFKEHNKSRPGHFKVMTSPRKVGKALRRYARQQPNQFQEQYGFLPE